MTVNSFFLVLLGGLLGIYLFFSPMDIQEKEHKEVPMLDLERFTVYELDTTGLQSVMMGSEGKRFSNRYEVLDVNYTDNSHKFIQTMRSDFARYQGEKVFLEGNVRYKRADGMMFLSDDAKYDHKRSVATKRGPFTIIDKNDWLVGKRLYYNSVKERAKGDEIKGSYTLLQIKEK